RVPPDEMLGLGEIPDHGREHGFGRSVASDRRIRPRPLVERHQEIDDRIDLALTRTALANVRVEQLFRVDPSHDDERVERAFELIVLLRRDAHRSSLFDYGACSEVDLRRKLAIDLDLAAAELAAAFDRRVIEEGRLHRLLELRGTIARDEDPRSMRLVDDHIAARPWKRLRSRERANDPRLVDRPVLVHRTSALLTSSTHARLSPWMLLGELRRGCAMTGPSARYVAGAGNFSRGPRESSLARARSGLRWPCPFGTKHA